MKKTVEIKSLEEMCAMMCDNTLPRRTRIVNENNNYDACYHTGIYEDYECELCPHKFECSGYEEDED